MEEENNKKEEKLSLVDLKKLSENPLFKLMIDSHLITEQGFRIAGMGLVLSKLDKNNQLTDKTNINLYHIEKKLGR